MDFAVSISWRSLVSSVREGNFNEHGGRDMPLMQLALRRWEQYLLGVTDDIGPFEQHIVLIDAPVSTTGIENSFDLGLYSSRGIEFNTMHSPVDAYIFTKLCRVVIVGTIKNYSPQRNWSGTLIEAEGEYRTNEDKIVPKVFFNFMEYAVWLLREARDHVTDRQREIMEETFFEKIRRQREKNE